MKWTATKCLIYKDLKRVSRRSGGGIMRFLLTNASFRITFWFRIGSYLKEKNGLWKILYFIVLFIHKHNQYLTGIQLPFGAKIGGGLTFPHFSCIVINGNVEIGGNCTIYQGVTIGSMRGKGCPRIGNNVILFAGSKIVGDVNIEDDVVIGANSVVVSNIPRGATAVGMPAKVVNLHAKKVIELYV